MYKSATANPPCPSGFSYGSNYRRYNDPTSSSPLLVIVIATASAGAHETSSPYHSIPSYHTERTFAPTLAIIRPPSLGHASDQRLNRPIIRSTQGIQHSRAASLLRDVGDDFDVTGIVVLDPGEGVKRARLGDAHVQRRLRPAQLLTGVQHLLELAVACDFDQPNKAIFPFLLIQRPESVVGRIEHVQSPPKWNIGEEQFTAGAHVDEEFCSPVLFAKLRQVHDARGAERRGTETVRYSLGITSFQGRSAALRGTKITCIARDTTYCWRPLF